MKHIVIMAVLTLFGVVGALAFDPFWGLAIYYLFGILRPQYIWDWSLGEYKDFRWSLTVATATIAGAVAMRLGLLAPRSVGTTSAVTSLPRITLAHVAVLIFGGWVTLTYFTALNRELGETITINYLKIMTMFAVASLITRTVGQVWALMVLTALALAYIAYEINLAYLVHRRLNIYHYGYGGLDNNGAGLMLAMGVPLCLFVWEGSTRRWRWGFLLAIPIIVHAVLMSYSRGAMLSLAVSCPLLLFRSRQRRFLLPLGAFFGILILPMLAGPEIRERFFSVRQYEKERSAQTRFESWSAAWGIAQDFPIFGCGPRNSNSLTFEYGADQKGRTIHSQYLQILADNGFPGLILYLLALACCAWSTSRVLRAFARDPSPDGRQTYAVACGVEGAMCVFCTGALFLSLEVFELPYLLLLMAAQLPVVALMNQKSVVVVEPLQEWAA